MMSLLRVGSAPRYVIYSYGQTLKPAPNGIVTSGRTFFGMVTNYQVVSETATRAVVRVEDAKTTHPHVVVESLMFCRRTRKTTKSPRHKDENKKTIFENEK